MEELKLIRNLVRNSSEIVRIAEMHRDLFEDYPSSAAAAARTPDRDPFDPYRDSEYEDDDRYHVLQANHMPADLLEAVVRGIADADSDLSRFYVQINRYDRGDYVLPHRDKVQQGLYMLTSSTKDGLVAQSSDGRMNFVGDRAGTLVLHDAAAWHWVDPVQDGPRYTLVTIPPRPPRKSS
ncbi:2OG-Fe(II) oxygenase [Streptomyces sp. BE147]|uniref:2OG-Fe(II) oxygenase n=1 Tax=Streptomyces sp. BE147 TaxID=3002524 RepID=UPI002E7A0E39|nr:2OG-Fe(II) oxygenase [Streptomyces sp. BE147]MEE1742600.1 2OG-Fe(II) oxygenase [Streptomyces sp. BE147]